MKLSAKTLDYMYQFYYDDHGSGEGALADRGCTCWRSPPCSRCTHPGNPACVDAIEAWETPEDAGAFALLIRETSGLLYDHDFKMVGGDPRSFAKWVDYANREVVLFWDLGGNCPMFKARYGLWRTPWVSTAEAAFVAAELDNWGRNAPLHELADMAKDRL